jgi:stress response protein YsnF
MANHPFSEPSEIQQSEVPDLSTPPAASGAAEPNTLQEGEVIRVEIYEEVPTVHRETIVREKVQIRKISTHVQIDP